MPYVNHFLSLPSDLHRDLCEIAKQRGISLSDVLIEALIQKAEADRIATLKKTLRSANARSNPKLLYA